MARSSTTEPGNKGHSRSAVEQRDSGSNLMLVDAQFLGGANPLLRYCLDPDC